MPRKGRYKHGDYTGIAVPRETVEKIDRLVAEEQLGYVSTGEFVRDAVRRLLEDYESKGRKKVEGKEPSQKD